MKPVDAWTRTCQSRRELSAVGITSTGCVLQNWRWKSSFDSDCVKTYLQSADSKHWDILHQDADPNSDFSSFLLLWQFTTLALMMVFISLAWFGSTASLKKVASGKWIQSFSSYMPQEVVSSRMNQRMGWRGWQWCISYATAVTFTTSQPNRTPMGLFEARCPSPSSSEDCQIASWRY